MKINPKFNINKLNKVFVLIAMIHWVISWFSDKMVFTYSIWNMSAAKDIIKSVMAWGYKVLFLVLLIVFWQGIYYFFVKADKRFLRFSVIYFVVMMAILLLCWPGVWRMDEFGILFSARALLPVFWQNYLTSVFYIFAMMLLPFPAGIIIVQIGCISLIVGYIMEKVEKLPGMNISRWTYLLYIPFFLLPVIDSNLYPMRMSLYAFLELLLLTKLFFLYQRLKSEQNQKIIDASQPKMLSFILLSAIVINWRTEAIYYFLALPVCFLILFHGKLQKKTIQKYIFGTIIISLLLFIPQQIGNKLVSGNEYNLTSMVLPAVPLVYEASLEPEKNAETLNTINQVLDVDIAIRGYGDKRSGISLYWSEPDFVKDFSDEEFTEFKNAYYKLISEYPQVFLKERFQTFLESNTLLENTTQIFTSEGVINHETFRELPLSKPISNSLRTKIVSILELRSSDNYDNLLGSYNTIYSIVIPIVFLTIVLIMLCAKRKWVLALLLAAHLVKIPLIILTAPSRLFMYYYPVFLVGNVLFFYLILRMLTGNKGLCVTNIRKTWSYLCKNGVTGCYYVALERIKRGTAGGYYGQQLAGCIAPESLHEKHRDNDDQSAPIQEIYKISILVPAYETAPQFLREMIDSVLKQSYSNLELILADASETETVHEVVTTYVDSRIHYLKIKENKGISANTNEALKEASGDYIGLLDHDDVLELNTLQKVAETIYKYPETEMLYTDEDKANSDLTQYFEPHYKPDFNLELLLSNNYICHFLLMKADRMKKLRFRQEYDGAQDYDLILRCVTSIMDDFKGNYRSKIKHLPVILYHWRCHTGSTAKNPESKMYAYEAGRRALQDFSDKWGYQALAEHTEHLGFYRLNYKKPYLIARHDVGVVGGPVIKDGKITGGAYVNGKPLFEGMNAHFGGYMYRGILRQEVEALNPDNAEVGEAWKMLYNEMVVDAESAVAGKSSVTKQLPDRLDRMMQFCEMIRSAGGIIVYDPKFHK